MKQSLIMGTTPTDRSLRVLMTSAMLFVALAIMGAGICSAPSSWQPSTSRPGVRTSSA